MLLGSLKRNVYAAFAVYLLTLFALWAPRLLMNPAGIILPDGLGESQMPLQAFLLNWLQIDGTAERWLTFAFTFLNACVLWLLNARHLFLKGNEHLLPLCYILLSSAVPETQLVFGAQLSITFLLLGTHYLFSVYQQASGLAAIFKAAFYYAFASLFFSPAVALIVLLPIAILIIHPFLWRDWVVMLAGVATPYLYFFLYYWLLADDSMLFVSVLYEHFLHPFVPFYPDAAHWIYLIVLGFLLLVSFFAGVSKTSVSKVKTSHYYAIFEWMLVFLLLGAVFYPANKYLCLPLIAVPASVFVTIYSVAPNRKKTKSRIFILMLYITAVLIVQLF